MSPLTTRFLLIVALIGVGLTYWRQQSTEKQPLDVLASTISRSAPFDGAQKILGEGVGGAHASIRRRVVAVADLHGDLEHAHNVLRMARLVDQAAVPNWIGGHDVLVSTGDIVDRGDDTIALYEMFQRLRSQARQIGGDVLNCIGNHEMMNALMDWRYVTPGDMKSFGGAEARRHAMSHEGWIGQDWLSNFSISHTIDLVVPEHIPASLRPHYDLPRASFVHGGHHPKWATRGLIHINAVGHSLLRKALTNPRPHGWLPDDATEEESAFYGEQGPLWYRGYALENEAEVCKEADAAREGLGAVKGDKVRHLVMGHTPHLSGFVVRCKAAVLLIDTGISRAYGGEQSALIFDTSLRSLRKTGSSKEWEEESIVTALYRGRLPKIVNSRTRRIKT